jgi:hypothetical protein
MSTDVMDTARPLARTESHPKRRRRPRRVLVLSHLTVSVAWLGLEVAMLALGVLALAGGEAEIRRAAILVAAVLGTWLYPLFSVGALVTGMLVSVRGPWGLVRHWWVFGKLIANAALVIGGNFLVLAGMRHAADGARGGGPVSTGAATSLVGAMTVGLLLLIAATVVSRYKPRGLTPFARVATGRSHS